MNNIELAEEYGKTGEWLHDIPVHHPNGWCSKCHELLGTLYTVSFKIQRLDMMDLQFEYHPECILKALNKLPLLNEGCKHLLKAD